MTKQDMVVKRFNSTWGAGYAHTRHRVVGQEAICDDNGYDEADIQAIGQLAVGEVWTAPTNEEHALRRLS
jgi:hypothetical protein